MEEEDIIISKKISKLVDKIFLLNHNIVNLMLSYNNIDKSEIEKKAFEKLAEYYEELRYVMREVLEISDEINGNEIKLIQEDEYIISEMVSQLREKTKSNIINTITNRIQGLYVSMNFVPIDFKSGNQSLSYVDSVYHGTPEESFRKLEYNSIINSIEQQMTIIEYEDFFEGKIGKQFIISPMISPNLIDAISDKIKYSKSEEYCKKFIMKFNNQKDTLEKYKELVEAKNFSENLMVEERYKKMFNNSVGLLNSKTNYGKFFWFLYINGELSTYTGFEDVEINSRLNRHIQSYSQITSNMIKDIYACLSKKYKLIRTKENVSNFPKILKEQLEKNIKGNYKGKVKNERYIKNIYQRKINVEHKKAEGRSRIIKNYEDQEER